MSTTENNENNTEGEAELRQCVQKVLDDYLNDLGEYKPDNLYQLFIAEVEAPLFEAILSYTKGNQSKAAKMLGINRGTLRKKISQYNL
ncbi:MAG: DNA-binding transcriptional regulator Fis [gamma proteobacterium symbiont of Taylorina sp.]|nr:DNA-binding transcriptional regulator Fis [gamma proteobacterium symbiont of Taylorina sp.]